MRGDAGGLERRAVGDSDVPVHPIEDCRMGARDRVDVRPCRRLLLSPKRVVPTTAYNPFARVRGLGTGGDPLLHLVQRFASHQVDVQFFKSAGAKMDVGIVEARHHEMATEVDHLGLRPFKLLYLFVRSHRNDLAAGDGDCLGTTMDRRRWGRRLDAVSPCSNP